jgi:hypothetical protein
MALTADRPYRVKNGTTEGVRIKMTTNDIYYKGALINLTAAGGLGIVASDTANQGNPTYIATEKLDNTGKTEYLECETGVVFIPFASAAQADVGDYVYATADDTIAMTATNANPIGIVVDVEVGVGSWVDLRKSLPKTALA